jgi:hypothetical protein
MRASILGCFVQTFLPKFEAAQVEPLICSAEMDEWGVRKVRKLHEFDIADVVGSSTSGSFNTCLLAHSVKPFSPVRTS